MTIFNNALAGAAGSGGAGGIAEIERSLRFNSEDSAYLNRPASSTGNRKTWTWSGWIKRSKLGLFAYPFDTNDGTQYVTLQFLGSGDTDHIRLYMDGFTGMTPTSSSLTIDAKLRDPSAWMHLIVAVDTTQTTDSDRVKIYINGVAQTFKSGSYPPLDGLTAMNNTGCNHTIGNRTGQSAYFDGYLAEIHHIDGQQLDQYKFGKFDANNVWQPISYNGTYGTNGYHLDFSDNTSTTTIGGDSSGNGNNFTAYGIVPSVNTYGTQYTLSGTTGQFYQNNSLSFGADNLFDGNILSACLLDDSDSTITFNLSPGIAFNSSFEIYYRNGTSVTTLDVNGVSQTVNNNYTSGSEWMNVTGVTSPVTSISWSGTNEAYGPYVYAVRVDGTTIITDGDPTTVDSLLDSPTDGTQTDTGAGGEVSSNYCTLNSAGFSGSAGAVGGLRNGNLDAYVPTSGHGTNYGTFGMSSGKWYWEITRETVTYNVGAYGIHGSKSANKYWTGWNSPVPTNPDQKVYYLNASDSIAIYNGRTTANPTGTAPWSWGGGTYMFAVDMDNHKFWVGKDGNWTGFNGTLFSLTSGDPASGLNQLWDLDSTDTYFPFVGPYDASADRYTVKVNFGQRQFKYQAPSGFKALCTANISETITNPSEHFDVKTWAPTNNADRDITGYNFQPDLAVIKCVSGTTNEDWLWADAVRTGDATNPFKGLSSNRNLAQNSVRANLVKTFNSDGFTLRNDEMVNYSAKGYVGYAWDASESFSVTANTYGSNRASSGRRNLTSGFSIVSYTGGGGSGETYAHGLNTKPGVIIVKRLDSTSDWRCAHAGIIPVGGNRNFIFGPTPQSANAAQFYTGNINNGNITDEVFQISAADPYLNASGGEYIAYCFAEVDGYCKIGSYTGAGANHPFVWTGFRPAFVMVKGYSSSKEWIIWDFERYGYNSNNASISPPQSSRENALVGATEFEIYSNGFALKGSDADINTLNAHYTFIAIAKHPFKTTRAR